MNQSDMRKNVIWNTTGSIFYSFAQWVITILVVHLASFKTAGFLSLAMTATSTFSAISLFGMRSYQISDVRDEFSSKEYIGSRIITCVAAYLGCIIVAFMRYSTYQFLCVNAFMLVRVAEAVVDVFNGEEQKKNRYDLIGKSYFLRGIATIGVFVLGLVCTDDLAITLFVIAFINLLIAFVYDGKNTSRLISIKPVVFDRNVMVLLLKCTPIVVFTFLFSLEGLVPKDTLDSICGKEALGIYSSIASPALVISIFANVIFNPFLPRLSETYQEENYDRFLQQLKKVYAFLAGVTVVTTIGAMLLGRWGLSLLLGPSILEYYYLFMPIVFCTILIAFIWVLSAILIALRKMNLLIVGMIISFMICWITVKQFVLNYNMNGVSYVQIVSYLFYVLYLIACCEFTVRRERRIKNKEV